MIGTPLNLSLPLTSDTMVGVVTKTAVALSQLADSIGDHATPSALDINTALEFGGNWVLNTGGVVLADGNNPTVPGSLYYHNGEFFLIDSTGAIQVTNTGTLNVASLGTIGGDYGGSNPALESYSASANEYRFFEDSTTNAWAGLSALSLKLNPNPIGAMTVVAPAGLSGSPTITLPAAISVTELLQMTPGGIIQPTTNGLLAKLRQWSLVGAFAPGDVTCGGFSMINDGSNNFVLEGTTTEGIVRLPPLWGSLLRFAFVITVPAGTWTVDLVDVSGGTVTGATATVNASGAAQVITLTPSSPLLMVNALYLRVRPFSGSFPPPPAVSLRQYSATLVYQA